MRCQYNQCMLTDLIAPLLTTEWGKRASWAAMVVTCLLFVYYFFHTLLTWYHDATLSRLAAPTVSQELSESKLAKIAALSELHLFGKYGALEQRSDLPITSLQLRLVGIIQAEPENTSRVMISENGQPAKIYQIGDSLPSGVKVHSVTRNTVILENGERLEKLPLQRPTLEFKGMPKRLMEN